MADPVPTPDGTPTPEPTPPQATQPTGNAPGQQSGKIAFDSEDDFQKEIDRRLGQRLAKEREKYADYKDLKAAADELAKIKESQLSETEKLTKRLAELEAAKAQAETDRDSTRYESAIIAEAAKLNFNDPNDAVVMVDRSLLKLVDGKVQGADVAVKALAESRKYLIKNGNPSLSTFNPAGDNSPLKETDAQRRARIYGGGGDIFDASTATQRGGGVVWPGGLPPAE
jgi:hypothetical protein